MPAPLNTPDAISDRLVALSALLRARRPLWGPRPFIEQPAPWEPAHAALSAWLRGLSDVQLVALELDLTLPDDAPAALLALRDEAAALTALPAPAAPKLPIPPRLQRRVPGRKRAQIAALAEAALPHLIEVTEIVDWCAGKGHLGRTLAALGGQPLVAVEWSAALCAAGEEEARALGVDARFVQTDAMGEAAAALLTPGRGAVALHACGALHEALLLRGHQGGLRALALSPCCYHRGAAGPARPSSRLARSLPLPLDAHELRLATAEEVVASPRIQRLRRREMAYRLGADAWLRDQGAAGYTPLPKSPHGLLSGGFRAFCEALLPPGALPARFDAPRYEACGWARAGVARRLSLLRALYRRPLELRLALDRAQWLIEGGWEVDVRAFCPRALTPRNLLITARRGAGGA